jgi:hypothetical protein
MQHNADMRGPKCTSRNLHQSDEGEFGKFNEFNDSSMSSTIVQRVMNSSLVPKQVRGNPWSVPSLAKNGETRAVSVEEIWSAHGG